LSLLVSQLVSLRSLSPNLSVKNKKLILGSSHPTTSAPTMLPTFTPTPNTLIQSDFSTNPPNNAALYGNAYIVNGVCVLTPNLLYQKGFLLFQSTLITPIVFEAKWYYRVADGTGADGTRFNYGLLNPPGRDEYYAFENGPGHS
jgi:hypothetical protein